MLALEKPNLALVGHRSDVRSCLRSTRKQAVRLDYAPACSSTVTQAQDCGVQIQKVGTEFLKLLVVQFRIEREVCGREACRVFCSLLAHLPGTITCIIRHVLLNCNSLRYE